MRTVPIRLSLATAQAALVFAGLSTLAFAPPESGRMLLVPLGSGDGAAVRLALDHGAALVGRGPWPGSIVVDARRADIVASAWTRRVLVVAAPPAGCGPDGKDGLPA